MTGFLPSSDSSRVRVYQLPGLVKPTQLPPAPALFVNRARELLRLDRILRAPERDSPLVVITAVGGRGGVGKTTLALRWAEDHADSFPDGQLFVDLQGFAPDSEPLTTSAAVRAFLDALKVPVSSIPESVDEQLDLYRSLMTGRRMVVMLDNAASSDQIARLLPKNPTCMVVVTSRNRLPELAELGVESLELDRLPNDEARMLLQQRLGVPLLPAVPGALERILVVCAGLPLALAIVADRAVVSRQVPLGDLAATLEEVARQIHRTREADGERTIETIVSWSFTLLTADEATSLGLLASAPGPDIGLRAASNLLGRPEDLTAALATALERLSLIQRLDESRYRMHDLIRLHAARAGRDRLDAQSRVSAMRRLIDFYLHSAYAADRQLDPDRATITLHPAVPGCMPQDFSDDVEALAWFHAEHAGLIAAQRFAVAQGWHDVVWQLAWVLDDFHMRQGLLSDQVAVWQVGVVAAEHDGNAEIQERAHRLLGNAYARAGRYQEAFAQLQDALALAENIGDVAGQAHTHYALTLAFEHIGDIQLAQAHAVRGLELYQQLGNRTREATMLNALSWLYASGGDLVSASHAGEQALAVFEELGHREGAAVTLDSLGYVARLSGHFDTARSRYEAALEIFRDLQDAYQQATTLGHLGDVWAALSEDETARASWQTALELFESQQRISEAERVREQLTRLPEKTDTISISVYLSDAATASGVETEIENLLATAGLVAFDPEPPVIESWFRRQKARAAKAASTPAGKELIATAAHAVEAKTVQAWDAEVTSKMLANLGPVLTAIEPNNEVVLRIGAILIVKIDGSLGVYQLNASQQFALDHAPQLAKDAHEILRVLNPDQNQTVRLDSGAGSPLEPI